MYSIKFKRSDEKEKSNLWFVIENVHYATKSTGAEGIVKSIMNNGLEERYVMQEEMNVNECTTCTGTGRVRVIWDDIPHIIVCVDCEGIGELEDIPD